MDYGSPIQYKNYMIKFNPDRTSGSGPDSILYLSCTVSNKNNEDTFEFTIPMFPHAANNPNFTHDHYKEFAVKTVQQYLNEKGLLGGQTHPFDFSGSEFISQ